MKKTFVILFVSLIIVLVTGCNKEHISNQNDDKYEETNKMVYYTKLGNINCLELNGNTKEFTREYATGYYFVNNDGTLYEFSFDKIYSNTNTNCSKVDTNGKYIAGFSGANAYDKNDYEWQLDDINGEHSDPTLNRDKSREYFIKKSFPNSNLQLFLITNFGIIVEDNKLYEVKFDLGGGSTDKKEINFDKSNEIVNIYDTHYSSEAFYVETNDSYFVCEKEIINSQECEIYADIECKKEFVCNRINDFENLEVKKFLGDIVVLENNDVYKNLNLSIE